MILDPRPAGAIERALALMAAAPGRIAMQVRAAGDGAAVHDAAIGAFLGPAREADVRLFVSSHVEVAARHGVGVHLPERAPEIAVVRAMHTGPIGVSCHDAAGLHRRSGADFAVLGPIGQVPNKGAPLGWDAFAAMTHQTPMPVYALGGIAGPDDVRTARAHGARGVAVMRAVSGPDAVDRLLALLSA